ncbi:MAG: hypothetical protein EAZ95_04135 [Bacteroidetes bacterium]|nr:MAG: hypothetical protein EAZ95_04135 [Bacteroidota bacterium]
MGKIKIKKVGVSDASKKKMYQYDLQKIEKITFQGEDIIIQVDETGDGFIDWDSQVPRSVLGKIEEINMIYGKFRDLSKCKDKLKYLTFDDKYEIRRLAEHIRKIIEDVPITKNITDIVTQPKKQDAISSINYTIDKEINILCSVKRSESTHIKESSLKNAKKHLSDNIDSFIRILQYYDPNIE